MENFCEVSKKECHKITEAQLITIGKNVKRLRIKNKLTQQDVSFFIFSDKSLVSSLERGVQKNITLFTLTKLAELFSVKIGELLINT